MLRTFIYAVFTLIISIGGFISARANPNNPWPGFIIAFGIVIWFFWGLNRRWKKIDERRMRERMFEEYMRNKQNFRGQY